MWVREVGGGGDEGKRKGKEGEEKEVGEGRRDFRRRKRVESG